MRSVIIGLVGASALATASAASATVNVDFGSAPGNLGPIHTYSTSVGDIVASGYLDGFFFSTPGDLYGKNQGGDEQGVGLAADPAGQNEIFAGNSIVGAFVELDVSAILGNVSVAQFFMGSTTGGEGWSVYGSNFGGCGWICGDLVATGTDEGTLHTLGGWGDYQYYDFYSNGTNGQAPGNVLLSGLQLTPSVPEPSTWAMMLLGFGALGMAIRKSRSHGIARLA